jgi:uncharacterized membrane protein YoaT (DUF817 family)
MYELCRRFLHRYEPSPNAGAISKSVYEFVRFGALQAWSSLYGGLLIAALFLTHWLYPQNVALSRYDFLVLYAVAVQIFMLASKLETKEEAKVIFLFHVVGTVMEIFKTAMGSWVYPEENMLRIGGVPLFTGFMYAAVGSYIARAWKVFNIRFSNHPAKILVAVLAVAIYLNFFLHHYWYDLRYVLFLITILLFGRSMFYYKVWHEWRSMPMLLGFFLVSFFIWVAENVGTFTATWVYPNQLHGWHLVSIEKLGSWFLLMMISYSLVSVVREVKER